jgi:hypothetical protein
MLPIPDTEGGMSAMLRLLHVVGRHKNDVQRLHRRATAVQFWAQNNEDTSAEDALEAQGDISMYSKDMLRARDRVRKESRVEDLLGSFWDAVVDSCPESGNNLGKHGKKGKKGKHAEEQAGSGAEEGAEEDGGGGRRRPRASTSFSTRPSTAKSWAQWPQILMPARSKSTTSSMRSG